MKGTEKGYDGVPGWNVDILNQEMFSFLEEECINFKKRIAEDPLYRLQEEHRSFMYTLSDSATILSFYVVANKGFGSNKDIGEDIGEEKVPQSENEQEFLSSYRTTYVPLPNDKATIIYSEDWQNVR